MTALEEERLANLPFNTRFNRTHRARSPASQATKLKVTFMTQTLPTRHHHFHQPLTKRGGAFCPVALI